VGWRASFGAIGGLGLLAMSTLLFALPKGGGGQRMNLRAEWRVLTRPAVLQGALTTVPGPAAQFGLYPSITPALNTFPGALRRPAERQRSDWRQKTRPPTPPSRVMDAPDTATPACSTTSSRYSV